MVLLLLAPLTPSIIVSKMNRTNGFVVPRSIDRRWIFLLSAAVLLSSAVNSFTLSFASSKSRSYLSSTTTTSSDADGTASSSSSSTKSSFLPDYGKTPVEIDQIKILKKKWRRPELFGQSLIEQTMNEIINSNENVKEGEQIKLTKEERMAQRRSLQQAKSVPNFEQHVHAMAGETSSETSSPLQLLHRKSIPTILQINIGLYCNQACHHCHGTLFFL
jgi:hypothetical protein